MAVPRFPSLKGEVKVSLPTVGTAPALLMFPASGSMSVKGPCVFQTFPQCELVRSHWSPSSGASSRGKALESAVVNPYLSKVLGYATLHDSSENTCNQSFKSFQKKYNYINIHSSFPSPWDLSCGRVDHQRIHIHVVACKEESKNSFLYMPHKEMSFSLYSFILFLFPAFTPQAIPWSTYIEQNLKWLINMLTLKKRHTLWGSAWKEIETMCYGN